MAKRNNSKGRGRNDRPRGGRRRGNRVGGGKRPGFDSGDNQDNGEPQPDAPGGGVLELHPNGYGFLRDPQNNYQRERTDPFVPGTMIDKFNLREGVLIHGMVQQGRGKQGPRIKELKTVCGCSLLPPSSLFARNLLDIASDSPL